MDKSISIVSMHCNNQVALVKTKQKYSYEFKRHIYLRLKILRYLQKHIAFEYKNTTKNISDSLTKGLTRRQVIKLMKGMELKSINWSSNNGNPTLLIRDLKKKVQ